LRLAMAQGSRPQSMEDNLQFDAAILPKGSQATTSAFSGGPAYDSRWVPLALDEARMIALAHIGDP
jgi:hypothetical protein